MVEGRVFGADEVARKEFATSFRGFDQHEVRSFLGRLAAELAALQERERSLGERLTAAEARAVPKEIGADELESALGVEAAKVLHAAREAATEIRTRAEEQVARLLREASDDATRMREEAATVLADRSADADRRSAAILDRAGREAESARAEASASAAATVDAAKEEGRRMVGEAQAVRERILKDLGRRRRAGQQQLEELRAGRDRLLESCRAVQGQVQAVVTGLALSEPEARAAAETAGLRVAAEPEPTLAELDAEVVAAVEAGLVVLPPPAGAPASDAPSADAPPPDGPPADSHDAGEATTDVAGPEPVAGEVERPAPTPPVVVIVDDALDEAPGAVGRGGAGATPPEPRSGGRKRKRKGGAPTVSVVVAGDADEGVRLLPPEPSPVSETPDGTASEGAPADPPVTAGDESGEPDGPAGGATSLPDAGEVAWMSDDAGPPEPVTLTVVPDAEDVSRPAPDEAADAGPKADQLFARIRADRAASVAKAEAVLAAPHAAEAAPSEGAPADGAPVRSSDGAAAPTDAPGEPSGGEAPADETEVAPPPAIPDDGVAERDGSTEVARAFEGRDGDVEPHERTLTRALKRALADEQNELLDALRTAKGVPTVEALLPPVDAHAARYADAARTSLGVAAEAGGGAELPSPEVDELAGALGAEVASSLRPRLARAVEVGAGDEAGVAEALSAAYREWKTSRAEALAHHHVLAAWAAGSFASTPDVTIRWVVDPEVGCSPDCADNALAGPTPKGDTFPTGHGHPPAHAGCRCLVLPADR